LKTPREENKKINVQSTLKDQTFKARPSLLMRRKHLTVPGEEKKHPNCAFNLENETSKLKIKTFKSKINH